MRVFFQTIALACAGLTIAGFIPSENAVLDTVSFFRPVFVAGMLAGFWAIQGGLRWGCAVLVLAVGVSIWASLPNAVDGGLRLYSKNIRYDNSVIAPLRDDILDNGVDVVVLQELSPVNRGILQVLASEFPHQAVCGTDTVFAMAVLSRSPFLAAPRCSTTRGLAAAQIDVAGHPVWVVSVHWPWPWPAGGKTSDNHMRALLAGLPGAVVLAGDFNTLPWTHRLTGAMQLTGTTRAGPTPLTLWHRKMRIPLPLDYVLSPGGGKVQARPLFGSDHMGLVADVSVYGTRLD